MENITIIGGGNLGKSIATGLVKSNLYSSNEIIVTGRSKRRLDRIKESLEVAVSTDNVSAIQDSKYIILCVQPKQLSGLLTEIESALRPEQVLISTITGVSIQEIEKMVYGNKVLRAMPNTAASKLQSITCIACENEASSELDQVQMIFRTIGKTLVIDETLMQSATVLGASGIAFFLRYIRAVTQGGIQMGFHPGEAQLIAVQTAIGAATLVAENNTHPEREIDKVTTPMGCTIAGLNEMEHQGLSSAVIKGLMASYEKINHIK